MLTCTSTDRRSEASTPGGATLAVPLSLACGTRITSAGGAWRPYAWVPMVLMRLAAESIEA